MSEHRTITQAVILSAGLGTRLKPLTDKIPKVMLPLNDKPLLEHHVKQFKKYGIQEFFINLHYLPEVIQNYFGNGEKFGVNISYALEPKILGTAGGIKSFDERLKDNFLVIYGDVFSLVDYSKMTKAFFEKKDAIGMELIGDTDHPQDSDLVEVDEELRFLKIYPKPHEQLPKSFKAMRGVYIFHEKTLSFIPQATYYEIDHELIPRLLAKGERFYGYDCQDYLKDIGTLDRYQEVQKYLKTKKGAH